MRSPWPRRLGAFALALVTGIAAPARADDEVKEPKTETTIVPLVGGSSDFGFGGGAMGAIARVAPGVKPYVWRIELASMTTMKPFQGSVTVPYDEQYLKITLAHLIPDLLRLEIRPSFTREGQLKYSGLGNASPDPVLDGGDEQRRHEYARTHPTLMVRGRFTLPHHLFLEMGAQGTYNVIDVRDDSRVARDRASADPAIRRPFQGPDRHGVLFFEWAGQYDSRDDETVPTSGQYHQLKLRLSPAGADALPYRYGQANVTLRAYATPIEKRLTLAGRIVGDLQFGNVPFYELARYEDTYALGGGEGVRGILAQRYYGKAKLFGGLETRTDLFDFRFLKKNMTFGFVLFFDAGRLWFDPLENPRANVDGRGLGLKYGTGGGLRIRAGQAFVVRADVGWSPDAYPLSAYLQANHAF